MCTRQECLTRLSDAAPFIRTEFGVKSMCLFGSFARGDYNDNSDIDVCVEMPPKAMKLISLKNYLQDLLGKAVDIVRISPFLDPYLRNEISRDAVYIFQ